MANLRQDGVPGPTLSHSSVSPEKGAALNGQAPSTAGVALSLRLRTSDASGAGTGVKWAPDSPAAALAADVLTSSGGTPDSSSGPILIARFSDLQAALLAARRLHWALEGLAESAGPAITASIAIHPVKDDLASSAAAVLESVAPGQVVLAGPLADALQQLPGVSLGPAGTGNWRALEWRSPAERSSLATDEQSVLDLIRALGREDPLANLPAPPAPSAQPADTAPTVSDQAPRGLGRSVVEPEDASQPIWKKPWVMISAGAVVLVIVAVLIIRAVTGGSTTPPQGPPSASSPAPAAPAAGPTAAPTASVPVAEPKPPIPKPSAKAAKLPKPVPQAPATTEGQAETPKPPPATACNLNEAEIPLSLQRASRLMSAGNLSEAQDAYQRLIGCPSAREKAAEGLRLVKQRIAAQGSQN